MFDNEDVGTVQSAEPTNNVPETSVSETQSTTAEFDVDRVDNISQLRDHVKGLKSDLDTYKSTHNFVAESFGDLENAKIAQQLYSGFVSEEFDPYKFIEFAGEISPTRARSLVDTFASQFAPTLVEQKMSEYFGGPVTPEEVNLFKQWRDSGYMVTQEDDIPEAFKFDSYGNPLSEEQVDVFKEQFKMLSELKGRVENQVQATEQRREQEMQQQWQQQLEQQVSQFDNANLKVLESDFAKVGLDINDSDAPEMRKQKEFVREFIMGGVGKLFLSDPELAKTYYTALSHLENGETRLAKRYEPKIQKGLLEIVRSEPISKLLSSLVPEAPRQARPEISSSGVSAPTFTEGGSREDRIRNLVASGALKI